MFRPAIACSCGVLLALGVAGCSTTESASSPASTAPQAIDVSVIVDDIGAPPSGLAFADNGGVGTIVGVPERWEAQSDAGVHSAPGALYTQVTSLDAGAIIVGTGVEFDLGDERWIEVQLYDSTGWVLRSLFAPST